MKRIDSHTVEMTDTECAIIDIYEAFLDEGLGVADAFDRAIARLGIEPRTVAELRQYVMS